MENEFKLIAKISDKDFFPEYRGEIFTNVIRKCVRGIVFDEENNIALVKVNHLIIPGGGVEEGETLDEAIKRECLEESGCEIDDIKVLGKTFESRERKGGVQETFCFTAKLLGTKGIPTTTQEDEVGMEVFWHPLNFALEKLKQQQTMLTPQNYNAHFNVAVHIMFLEEAMRVEL